MAILKKNPKAAGVAMPRNSSVKGSDWLPLSFLLCMDMGKVGGR